MCAEETRGPVSWFDMLKFWGANPNFQIKEHYTLKLRLIAAYFSPFNEKLPVKHNLTASGSSPLINHHSPPVPHTKSDKYLQCSRCQKSNRAQESKSQSAVFTRALIELRFCWELKIENVHLWIKAALRADALFPASIRVLPTLLFRHSLNLLFVPRSYWPAPRQLVQERMGKNTK